ncbi:hypothetical protein HO133_001303 [Letharia lupina]|uniref:Replication factor A protein 3 n=1 Tax=Letharia lupina TaxID=560253 RepID=A0A8H6FBD5_9LECA|nr:uncharacterized protein HO133_001303 [Letharia lupina]KAF6222217.1 hypothetical protein HO133_001303 [Letharia lupina]
MASEATPRVNAKYLDSFTNQTVRILGKVVSLRGETATIDANGTINVQLNRDAHLQLNNAVEVVGKVQQDLSVKVFQATDFGSNIDFIAVEAVVDATHRYKEIFYDSND